jgi:hypothetical protein
VGELALMGMINTNATAMIPAVTGYEVVSIEAAGEVARWPIIGWGIVPHYGYGDSGCILPVTLGIVFNAEAHVIVTPDGRALSMADGTPRFYKDAKMWASAGHGRQSPVRGRRADGGRGLSQRSRPPVGGRGGWEVGVVPGRINRAANAMVAAATQ